MNGRETLRIIAAHGAIVVVVLICSTVLTAIGQMPEAICESFFGAALAWAGAVSSGVIRRQVPRVQSPVAASPETGIRPADGPAVAVAAAPVAPAPAGDLAAPAAPPAAVAQA